MPEIAIYEDGDPRLREYDVGFTREISDICPEPITKFPERGRTVSSRSVSFCLTLDIAQLRCFGVELSPMANSH